MKPLLPAEPIRRIADRLARLYGAPADRLLERLILLMGRYQDLGAPGDSPSRWDETDTVLITYGESVRRDGEPPLHALRRFAVDHLAEAIGIIHILPFTPFSSDDGFSVIDYRSVREDLGTWDDMSELAQSFDLMFDLVLNHCSSQGSWFRDYQRGIAPGRHYFHEVDPAADLSQVVRPRSLPLLTPVQTPQGERQVWTTFSSDQVDLDFANPDVLFEFLDILFLYLEQGARILRLDAIAYLWKRIGTSCIHLPETHEVVKLFRDVLDVIAPQTILLTETNVPHAENISYFGEADEAHMVYQFSLPPLLLHALLTGNGKYLSDWADSLAPLAPGCTYLNFTASHDGIGVRPLQGLIPAGEFDALLQAVTDRGGNVSTKRDADGNDSPYELNITYFSALGDPADADSLLQEARFLCSQTLALGLQGMPAVYIHSLTATENDPAGVQFTGQARSINRRQWDEAELAERLADPRGSAGRVFPEYLRRLAIRRAQKALHPEVPQRVLRLGDAVFGVDRRCGLTGARLIMLCNLTAEDAVLRRDQVLPKGSWTDLIADERCTTRQTELSLAPYQCRWFVPRKG